MVQDLWVFLVRKVFRTRRTKAWVNPNAFDGRGNYALGIKEQLIFPEIEYDKVDKVRGMDIIFVTTANTDEEARELLTQFNMPFTK